VIERFIGRILQLIAHRPWEKENVYGAHKYSIFAAGLKAESESWIPQHLFYPKALETQVNHGSAKLNTERSVNQTFREL